MLGPVPLPVRVRNLSPRGALLDGGSLPPPGASVRLIRGDLSVEGEIAWQVHGQAGIRFSGAIDVAVWVKKIGHTGQQRVDDTIAAFRSNSPLPAHTHSVQPLSLACISHELDAVCERLAGSAAMVAELGDELVKLDTLAQNLRELASRAVA
jgi:hypothetical protein